MCLGFRVGLVWCDGALVKWENDDDSSSIHGSKVRVSNAPSNKIANLIGIAYFTHPIILTAALVPTDALTLVDHASQFIIICGSLAAVLLELFSCSHRALPSLDIFTVVTDARLLFLRYYKGYVSFCTSQWYSHRPSYQRPEPGYTWIGR